MASFIVFSLLWSTLIISQVEVAQSTYSWSGGNVIDDCWRYDPNWSRNRMHLADCAVGFGKNALGGKGGKIYVVTDSGDDPVHPRPGTLRYGTVQRGPNWIIFARDMNIILKKELMITSYTTIDGRGANVVIGLGGPCLTVQFVGHVIIHGLTFRECRPSSAGMVMTSVDHTGRRNGADGDAIAVFGSNNVWIDHNTFSHCFDGLVDIIHASSSVTVSNNHFSNHDKVMLFGHSDGFSADRILRVTVIYNHFTGGVVERMPRLRYGYCHVVNNNYEGWEMYAIGGSSSPTILSEGNRFLSGSKKEITKRETKGGSRWVWKSRGDMFLNGAFFVQSGVTGKAEPGYTPSQKFPVRPAGLVPRLTATAGALGRVR